MLPDDRRAAAAARRLDLNPALGRPGSAAGDPYLAAWLALLDPREAGPRLESGVVVDVVPGGYCYRVAAGTRSFLWCSPGGTAAGFSAFGARPLTSLPLGSTVWFVRHPETPYVGTIVAAEPPWLQSAPDDYPADGVWPFVRSGQRAEAAHQAPVQAAADLGAAGSIPLGAVDTADFSAGRPVDATAAGEWGVMTELGVGVFVDPHQAYLRVDEATGVFAFYADQTLRIAGHTFQWFTSHGEAEWLEDEGELAGWTRECVYPWEPPGLWRPNQVTPGWADPAVAGYGLAGGQGTTAVDPAAVLAGSGEAVREPETPAQLPAARKYAWSGYLGQGGRTVVAAPAQLAWAYPEVPAGAVTAAVAAVAPGTSEAAAPGGRLTVNGAPGPAAHPYAVPANARGGPDQPGVVEEQRTLAGSVHHRVVGRYVISKRPSIPTPRPVRRPEDPGGDSPAGGYAPSGRTAAAPRAHAVEGTLLPPGGPAHRACMLPDVLAYAFNWEGLHPFAYHADDWAVAEEGAAGSTLVNQRPPAYAGLAAADYLDAPSPAFLDVDHRYGLVPVYEAEAYIAILEDGGITLGDGWGSEIRMTGGHIELHCAGDVRVHSGRSVIVWGGDDVDVKAHNSLDLSCVHGDLRTAAGRNQQHLAGASGCGGFLYETKAVCPAYDFAGKLGEDVTGSGFVVLAPYSQFLVLAQDAVLALEPTADDGRIVLDAGADREVHTRARRVVTRVPADGTVLHLFDGTGAAEFTATYTALGADVYVCGAVVPAGAPADRGVCARIDYLKTDYGAAFDGTVFTPVGAADAEFSHRTVPQYRSAEFAYWRSRWQAIAAADAQALPVWSEAAVVGLRSGESTRAHPGDRWTEAGSYRAHTFVLVDPPAGWTAVSRTAARALYETPTPAAAAATALEADYLVTVPPGTTTTTTTTTTTPGP